MSLKFNRLVLIAIFLATPFIMSCYAPINDPFKMDRYLMDYATFINKSKLAITQVQESDVTNIEEHAQYKMFVAPINYESKGSYVVIYDTRYYQDINTLADLANVKESYFNMSYLLPDNHTVDWGAGGEADICIGVDNIILTEETITKGVKIDKNNKNDWYLYYNNSWWKWNALALNLNWNNLYPTPLAIDGTPVQ